MDLFARRDDFSADPFDAVLATARGIGFSIPDPQRDCYDIERASHITNLVQLMEMGNQVPDLKSALFALEQNRLLNGFLDTRELRRYTQGLQLATEALQSFEEQKAVLVEKLTRDDTETGIPVESDDQEAFTQIIQAIAQDKYGCSGRLCLYDVTGIAGLSSSNIRQRFVSVSSHTNRPSAGNLNWNR